MPQEMTRRLPTRAAGHLFRTTAAFPDARGARRAGPEPAESSQGGDGTTAARARRSTRKAKIARWATC